MNPKAETLPGLRRPTAAEQAWIAESWTAELQNAYSPNGGKLTRYIGVFLVCTGTVSLMRGGSGLMESIMIFVLASICLWFSSVGKKASRSHGARITAVKTGDYLVTEAFAAEVDATIRAHRPAAYAGVVLPDGRKLDSIYRIPHITAGPYLNQKNLQLPILLIRFSCDSEILAIPVK